MLLLLLAAVFMAIFPNGHGTNDSNECSSGLRTCLKKYVKDVTHHTTDTEICHDVGTFVSCILELDCDLTHNIKVHSFNMVEMGLADKGLKCKGISKLKGAYLDGFTVVKSHSVSSKPKIQFDTNTWTRLDGSDSDDVLFLTTTASSITRIRGRTLPHPSTSSIDSRINETTLTLIVITSLISIAIVFSPC